MGQTAESSTAPRELVDAVLRHLRDAVIVFGRDGRPVWANDEAARLTGYASATELLTSPPGEARERFEINDAEGRPFDLSRLPHLRALAGEDPGPVLVRFRRGGEPQRVSEVTAVAIVVDGVPQYAVSYFREVTEEQRLAAEQRTAAAEYAALYRAAEQTTALLDALFRSAPVGLGFWDRDLRYVRVNEALAEINERAPDDHVGKTLADVIPQLAHVIEPIARRVLDTGRPVVALEMSGGTPRAPESIRHWRASYYPVVAPDGEVFGVGAVVEETTARRRAEQRTELQYAVSRILTGADTEDDALPRVLETLCEELGWDVACYWSVDPDARRVMWSRPGVRVDGFLAMTERASLSPELLPGRVAAAGAPEWLETLDPDRFVRASVAEAEGLLSGVAFPVLVDGAVVGVLEVYAQTRQPKDEALERSLAAVGAQVGQFLRRKHAEEERQLLLLRERQARSDAEAAASTLRKLGRVSEAALEHLSLEDLLPALLDRIVEVLDADAAAILLLGDDGLLHVRATVGLDAELHRAVAIPLGEGMAGRVAERRETLLVADLAHIELFSPVLHERGINSLVAIPLVVEDRVIGVVHADSVAYAQFADDDARLLELIADRIALAINQASLFEAERAAQERLQFLGEASMLLASSLDVDRTIDELGSLLATRFADWTAIHLVQPHGGVRLATVAHRDPEKMRQAHEAKAAQAAGLRLPSTVVETLERGVSMRWAARPDELEPGSLEEAEGLHSGLVVPLVARSRILGTLSLARAAGSEPYDDGDLGLAEDVARRAALALDNAQLYREAAAGRDRLGFLAEASALLASSLDVDRTLEQLGALVAGRVADRCAIHLAVETGAPRLVALAHRNGESRADGPTPFDGRAAAVIRSGAPELNPAIPQEEQSTRSCMVVPLQARGRTFGAMSLAWAETDATYDEPDLEFALDLARRAGVAVDNAQLYRAAEERSQAARVLASVGDGVFLVDRNGYVRTWNRAAAAATGLRATDVVDRLAAEVIGGWSSIVSRIPIVAAGSGVARAESLPLELGDRELWLSLHGVVVPDGIVYAFRDFTEERALETMRTEFVSTVSHELRTPLAAIYGAAMTLRRSDVDLGDEQRARLLEVVSGEADRLARTVNDILWASRLDTDSLHVNIQNCDPAHLAQEVVEAQLTHLDRGHQLVLDVAGGLPLVAGDPDKVGRVLINLVDNAVKYSPDGGRVDVAVRVVGTHVRFSVSDPGLGVPASEQRRIFEKFYRLDPNMNRGVGGTGLGLYICRELVRRMEGRIWVDSAGIGRGSVFHVELPVATQY